MRFRPSAIASAISLALSQPAYAVLYIEQNADGTLTQVADNLLSIGAGGDLMIGQPTADETITQLGVQQINTLGWGQTGGGTASALDVLDGNTILRQLLTPAPAVRQTVENTVEATSAVDTYGETTISGVNQIGATQANAAGVALSQDARLTVIQEVGLDSEEGFLFGSSINNRLVAERAAGTVTIAGELIGEGDATTQALQFAQSGVNTAQVFAVAADGSVAPVTTLTLRQASRALELSVNNTAIAVTGNGYPPVSGDDGTPGSAADEPEPAPEPLELPEPAVVFENRQQLAILSANALTFLSENTSILRGFDVAPGSDAEAQPGGSANQYLDGDGATLQVENLIVAGVGAYQGPSEGAAGDTLSGPPQGSVILRDVAQTVLVTGNTVTVTGPGSGDQTTPAGAVAMGMTESGEVGTFEQAAARLRISGSPSNALLAFTGIGDVSLENFTQIQSVSLNSVRTSGNLTGWPGSDDDQPGNPAEPPDDVAMLGGLRQSYRAGGSVQLGNEAQAVALEQGNVSIQGDQTLSFALNSLSADTLANGRYTQSVQGESSEPLDVVMANNILASAAGGGLIQSTLSISEEGEVLSIPLNQTLVSSINSMSLASIDNALIAQEVAAPINQVSSNLIQMESEPETLSDFYGARQIVINRINTLSVQRVSETVTIPTDPIDP
jgi:hypothetical protein